MGALYALICLGRNMAYVIADLSRRLSSIICQLTDFFRNHCKSSSCISRSRRFNGRIQGQQISLLRNVGNGTDKTVNDLCLLTERLYILSNRGGNVGGLLCPVTEQTDDADTLFDHLLRLVHQLTHLFNRMAYFLKLFCQNI